VLADEETALLVPQTARGQDEDVKAKKKQLCRYIRSLLLVLVGSIFIAICIEAWVNGGSDVEVTSSEFRHLVTERSFVPRLASI
jgi:hypothetical protein